MIIKKAVLRL